MTLTRVRVGLFPDAVPIGNKWKIPDVKFMLKKTNEAQDAKIIEPITSLGSSVSDIDSEPFKFS
jgi:hypothetical protein